MTLQQLKFSSRPKVRISTRFAYRFLTLLDYDKMIYVHETAQEFVGIENSMDNVGNVACILSEFEQQKRYVDMILLKS